jgi:hypothetical protein
MVIEKLPKEYHYHVLMNQSFDGQEPKPGEILYPEDEGKRAGPLNAQGVVDLLWRDGKVPEWIDLFVSGIEDGRTCFALRCCGRFTARDDLLYYHWNGTAPFGLKSPPIPPHTSGSPHEKVSNLPKFSIRESQRLFPL